MTDDSNKRHSEVARMLPKEWDNRPFTIATELREKLSSMKDEGTVIDSGSGFGKSDLWVWIDDVEYLIQVSVNRERKSKK